MTNLPAQGGSRSWRLWLMAGIVVFILAADQLTKSIMVDLIGPDADRRAIDVIPGVLRFFYLENTGAAFGIMQDNSGLLAILALAVIAFLITYFYRAIVAHTWLSVAIGLQIGGAFGNVIDRVRFGYVIDFIDVPRFPTFNVADSAITVGVIIMAVTLLLYPTADRHPGEDDASTAEFDGDDRQGVSSASTASGQARVDESS